jgi:hypothetical protein
MAIPLALMVALQIIVPRMLGGLDWQARRAESLRDVLSIPLSTYAKWTIDVVVQSIFPLAPLLLAPLVRWRRALLVGAVAVLLIVPVRWVRGEILSPIPDWQTWSMQDIAARAVIGGDAAASPWSQRVMPFARALGLVTVAALFVLAARGPLRSARWRKEHAIFVANGVLLLAATHVLWLYNDRYYLVFAPAIAVPAAAALDRDRRAQGFAAAGLALWAFIGVTGTRDLLAFNDACAQLARDLESTGVPPSQIDAGYPLNGWRLYAHSEHLPPGADRRYDVPFVTSRQPVEYAVMSHPPPGAHVVRVVPLPRATWQATHELYLVKRP